MKPAQSVDVDWAVIHPDTLRDSGRLLEAKEDLVDRIKYVVHFLRSLSYQLLAAHIAHRSLEFVRWTSSSIQSTVV
jgi:hypothetical protein